MKTYGGRGCKSRRASARSMARLVVAPLAFAVLLFAMVRNAYAEVDWHEKNDTMSATVAPWNYPDGRAYALAEFLGYDWGSLSVEVQESILTDSNGDNAFTQMLDHNVLNVQYESGEGTLNWPIINLWSTLFGLDKMWDINVSRTRYNQAKEVMEKWMFPREEESEGGNEEDDEYVAIHVEPVAEGSYANSDIQSIQYVAVTKETYDSLKTYADEHEQEIVAFVVSVSGSSLSWKACSVCTYPRDQLEVTEDTYKLHWKQSTYVLACDNSSRQVITVDGVQAYKASNASRRYVTASYNQYYPTQLLGWDGDSEGGGGDYEPTPKPEPTRPQLPEITINTTNNNTSNYDYSDRSTHVKVDLPDISIQPDFDVTDTPWDIAVSVDLDPTISITGSGDDVIPWLQKILAAINALRSENREDFNFLRELNATNTNVLRNGLDDMATDMLDGMGLIYDYMATASELMHEDLDAIGDQIDQTGDDISQNIGSVIANRISWLAENLVENINALDSDILSELHSDAKYIVDNLEFDASYDDSTLITWLKKIYGKLSKNPSGIPDVTTDPDGWTDAIEDLIRKLLEGLVGAANVAELAQMMNELQDRFPISIPWDLMAIVTLFSGEAVTPQYDFPIYFGSEHITDISIDLTPYEEVGRVSRIMSLLIFACMLLLETKNLLRTSSVVTRKAG